MKPEQVEILAEQGMARIDAIYQINTRDQICYP